MVANSRDLQNSRSIFCGTRYGNVMASRGSVIPLMIDQIKSKKPITITDGTMTRFLMPMSDAIELVLYAMKNAKNGDIYVKKTYATNIQTLAKSIIKYMKKKNWPIKQIGNRHGEKKHECLLSAEEYSKAKDLKSFFKIESDVRDLNYNNYFSKGNKIKFFQTYSSNNTKILNERELNNILNSIKKDLT